MNSESFLKEMINYLERNYLIFLIAYILIVMVQLVILYKKNSKIRILLFSLHKIIAFVAIGYLLLYCKNILGFYWIYSISFCMFYNKKRKNRNLRIIFNMGCKFNSSFSSHTL